MTMLQKVQYEGEWEGLSVLKNIFLSRSPIQSGGHKEAQFGLQTLHKFTKILMSVLFKWKTVACPKLGSISGWASVRSAVCTGPDGKTPATPWRPEGLAGLDLWECPASGLRGKKQPEKHSWLKTETAFRSKVRRPTEIYPSLLELHNLMEANSWAKPEMKHESLLVKGHIFIQPLFDTCILNLPLPHRGATTGSCSCIWL